MSPRMSLTHGRTALLHFLSQVVVSFSGFVATYAIARLLGAAPLGEYSKAVAILFFLMIPAAAIGSAVTKRMSEGTDPGYYFGAGTVQMGVVMTILVFGTIVAGPVLNEYVGESIAFEFALLVTAAGLFRLISGVLQGEKEVAKAGFLRSFERIARTGGQITFILSGFFVSGLIVGHTLSLLAGAGLGLMIANSRVRLPTRKHIRHLYEYVQFSWMGKLKGRSFGWTDTIVLGVFVSSSLVGIYEVAWSLASTLILVSNSIQQTLFPEFSDLGVDEDYDRIHHFLNEGLVFTAIFAIPGFFGAVIVGPRVLEIYNTEFRQGATILLLLILARLVAAFGEQFLSAINAIDRPDVAFRISALFIGGNVILNVGLVWMMGWIGAAIATFIAATGLLILGYTALTRLIGRPEIPWSEFAAQLGAALVMSATVLGTIEIVPGGHYWTVFTVLGGCVVYVGTLLTFSRRIRNKAIAMVGR